MGKIKKIVLIISIVLVSITAIVVFKINTDEHILMWNSDFLQRNDEFDDVVSTKVYDRGMYRFAFIGKRKGVYLHLTEDGEEGENLFFNENDLKQTRIYKEKWASIVHVINGDDTISVQFRNSELGLKFGEIINNR
jgi:hypothetical protein